MYNATIIYNDANISIEEVIPNGYLVAHRAYDNAPRFSQTYIGWSTREVVERELNLYHSLA